MKQSKHRTSHYIGSKIKGWWKLPGRQREKHSPGTALRCGAHFSHHLTCWGGEHMDELKSMRVFTADFSGARISPQGSFSPVQGKCLAWHKDSARAEQVLAGLVDTELVTCFRFWHTEGNATEIAAQLRNAVSTDSVITDWSQIQRQIMGPETACYFTPVLRLKPLPVTYCSFDVPLHWKCRSQQGFFWII